jgi:cell wall-associated NlpC family hydrolase
MVLADVFGIAVPSYVDAYTSGSDHGSVANAVDAGLAAGWEKVSCPDSGDLLILKIGGRPWHCAIMVNRAQFLHWPPPRNGVQLLSCVERLGNPMWTRRIDGFWRRSHVAT